MNRYFFEVFENIPRQGPGQNSSTRKAFNFIKKHLPDKPEILDVGCGKGVQTLELARISKGKIKAFDNHEFFLDCLELTAQKEGYKNTITCTNADMKSMPFKN